MSRSADTQHRWKRNQAFADKLSCKGRNAVFIYIRKTENKNITKTMALRLIVVFVFVFCFEKKAIFMWPPKYYVPWYDKS